MVESRMLLDLGFEFWFQRKVLIVVELGGVNWGLVGRFQVSGIS